MGLGDGALAPSSRKKNRIGVSLFYQKKTADGCFFLVFFTTFCAYKTETTKDKCSKSKETSWRLITCLWKGLIGVCRCRRNVCRLFFRLFRNIRRFYNFRLFRNLRLFRNFRRVYNFTINVRNDIVCFFDMVIDIAVEVFCEVKTFFFWR